MASPSDYIAKPFHREWRVGEENSGGGCNIYCGSVRVAHTSEVSAVNAKGGRPISAEEAKENAGLIVAAVNFYFANDQQPAVG